MAEHCQVFIPAHIELDDGRMQADLATDQDPRGMVALAKHTLVSRLQTLRLAESPFLAKSFNRKGQVFKLLCFIRTSSS